MQNETDLYDPESSYSAVDFVVGLLITLAASLANALGLNITKLDFTRQEALPPSQRKPDFLRPYWLLGLVLYIASQVVGSTLALAFLPAQYVAPLGSASLIFNFIFAYLLVGTAITRLDILGTATIVVGVVGVVVFGNQKDAAASSFDENNLDLSQLKKIWARGDWIAYLICLEFATLLFWWLSSITGEVCFARITDDRGDADRDGSGLDQMLEGGGGRRNTDPYAGEGFVGRVKSARDAWHRRQGKVREVVKQVIVRWSQSRPEVSIRKLAGLMWSITGGLLSGQTLVLAKSAVKLVSSAIDKSDPNGLNQFASPLTWVIIVLLVVCAVTQVYCLNASLKCYESTLCVPAFFATYTTSGFINSLVYLDQRKTYKNWVFAMIWVFILILICGVLLLSSKAPPKTKTRNRAGSSASQAGGANPFDDPAYELDSPVKPGFARAEMDLEAGAASAAAAGGAAPAQEEERKRGQGWLSKLFGGLPAVQPSSSSTPSAPTTSTSSSAPASTPTKRDPDTASTFTADADGQDSVFASERASQRGADELELDEVDRLGYAPSFRSRSGSGAGRKGREEDEDWGEFEEATGAKRVG
ncbi:hypothetical protein JCM8097_007108 [Rhodosporidiobolus ruineniae]